MTKNRGERTDREQRGEDEIRRCQLFTDGASRGNPGLAGAGAVIYSEDGRELYSLSEFLGTCTNNVAEYRALISGVKMAVKKRCRSLDIFLDSELIVRQITGRYKVKSQTLKPLFATVMKLLNELKGFTVNHIPRAKNSRADELANRGIDDRKQETEDGERL
jgi:ribonuclease HI/probable phosphoglycerate mutase